MGRLVQGRLTQCLVVIGKMQYQSRARPNKGKTHFLRIWFQMRIMLGWSPELFMVFLKKLRIMSQIKVKATISIVLFCKSIMKRSMIYFKTFLNQNLLIYISLSLMAFLLKDLLNMQLLTIWIVLSWWREEKRIGLLGILKRTWKVVGVILSSKYYWNRLVRMPRACLGYYLCLY